MRRNDWHYAARTFGWAFLVCEGLNLAALLVALLLFLLNSALGFYAFFALLPITLLCQGGVLTSFATGLLRRRALEEGAADDSRAAANTFGINFGLLSLAASIYVLCTQGATLGIAASVILPVGLVGTLTLIFAPVLAPVILMSQDFMTRTAQNFPRPTHA